MWFTSLLTGNWLNHSGLRFWWQNDWQNHRSWHTTISKDGSVHQFSFETNFENNLAGFLSFQTYVSNIILTLLMFLIMLTNPVEMHTYQQIERLCGKGRSEAADALPKSRAVWLGSVLVGNCIPLDGSGGDSISISPGVQRTVRLR